MEPTSLKSSDHNSQLTGPKVDRKGSVKRARQMLEAGRRPDIAMAPSQSTHPGPTPKLKADQSHMTQWPLPTDGSLQTNVSGPQARLFIPKGPPPERPPRPDAPSPSVYSERSMSDIAPSPLHLGRPIPSFSHPLPHPPPPRPPFKGHLPPYGPERAAHPAPRVPMTTDESLRQSTASSFVSIPSIPDFALPAQPTPAEMNLAQRQPQGRLAPSNAARFSTKRRSSVSPIPEELSDSPTILQGSYASSRVIPSSWGSAPAGSEILGAYLDVGSDDDRDPTPSVHEGDSTLVRQASLGKRGKPSLRTIQKPSSPSPVSTVEEHSVSNIMPAGTASEKIAAESKYERHSVSTVSTESSEIDPEKPPIVVDINGRHPALKHTDNDMGFPPKELEILPKAAPTMSDKRPGGRRPPRLDIGAVRAAEARGSLTSLPDLIRRATKLASNLEHGRTASRNDLLNNGTSRFAQGELHIQWAHETDRKLRTKLTSRSGHNARKSGSIKDILASFPPPAGTPEVRSSWPDFFRRTPMHHLRSNDTGPETGEEKGQQRSRRCCGMPPWLFIFVCFLIIAIILVAVLVPVFLVAVPRHKSSSSSGSQCEKTTPCENGGVSVSSGSICSCVCANGYTGSRCTVGGDASCVTTEIVQGSTSKNATMGSDLPRLFEESSSNFSIPLDPISIMALFSQNNVSCTTENSLVSFKSLSSTSNKARRASLMESVGDWLISEKIAPAVEESAPSSTTGEIPTQTLAARGSVGTKNGILFDESYTSTAAATTATPSSGTATEQTTQGTPPPKPTSTPTPAAIPAKVLDFSRIAVLYIFEKTAAFNAAMQTEGNIETYLAASYSTSQTGTFDVDLSASGIKGNFTLNFDEFTITMPNGTVVGGK
ncbi:uncharacterized protein CDV56_100308 [Aspergillus thermomutatus]|uniref:EGF-like domain-containing protein n=1 Tax=Aspergillus thermomutatus TaxID=41047 RepID=A0A397G9P0_ASPTH|nr:uncharacterized protein CDV56_100308 [Aspergillus thermomutatus]RHZ47277.1 hypothetical protein CDV56_100308 [Aspergillus thermomutatus]